jgi:hypothetical protein
MWKFRRAQADIMIKKTAARREAATVRAEAEGRAYSGTEDRAEIRCRVPETRKTVNKARVTARAAEAAEETII